MLRVSGKVRHTLTIGCVVAAVSCSDQKPDEPLPGLSAPEEVVPKRQPAPTPQPRRSKNAVTYTIARGGTLLNVANLYKLHHHEIIALNPHIDPNQELPPSSEVVVFDSSTVESESVGLPHDGRVVGAVPMSNGPGRIITAERWKTWATQATVSQLDSVLRRWDDRFPDGPPVLVGNLSARHGGPLQPHKTHQSGRDVDLSYVAEWDGKSRVTWQKMNASNLDAGKTWALLKSIVTHADVETIFIDRSIQLLLLAYARRHGTVRKQRLSHWLEVAANAKQKKRALIRHVPGHDDHMHVRFVCRPDEKRCRS